MEYKDISEFIKDKKLDKVGLIGKNMLFAHSYAGLEEYTILEIVPSEGEHIKVLMKLQSVKSGEKNWLYIEIKNIKFVKVVDPASKQNVNDEEKPSTDDRAEYFRKLIEALEVNKKYRPLPSPKPSIVDWPTKPHVAPYTPEPIYPPQPIICGMCGLNCSGTMGYCCPNHYCPMGMGPILCKATAPETPQSTTLPVTQSTCVSQNTVDDPAEFHKIG